MKRKSLCTCRKTKKVCRRRILRYKFMTRPVSIHCLWFLKLPQNNGYLRFNSFSISTSVISGRWPSDNERLCAMKPCLLLKRDLSQAGLELRTARSVGQRAPRERTIHHKLINACTWQNDRKLNKPFLKMPPFPNHYESLIGFTDWK